MEKNEMLSAEAALSASDIEYMKLALKEAELAEGEDEVPIGAVIVREGKIVASAHNKREQSKCATSHAEILAIEEACRNMGGWRLPNTTLYVTLEPCAMCAGAIINARIPRVVFAAYDIRFGAFGSLVNLAAFPFNHKPEVIGGVMEKEAREQLSAYFKTKRKK